MTWRSCFWRSRRTSLAGCVSPGRRSGSRSPGRRHRRRTAGARRADAIYGVYFHGPALRVLERVWRGEQGPVGLLAMGLPADHALADRPEVASPRLVELVFQTAGIWEIGRHRRFGLPQHVDRVVLHPAVDAPRGRVEAVVEPVDGGFDGRVVDGAGSVLVAVHGYRTVELPGGVDPQRQAPLAAAMA